MRTMTIYLRIQLLIFILAIVDGFGVQLFAQNAKFEMAGSFGSAASDEPHYAVTDNDGNYYAVGLYAGAVTLPGGTNLTGRGGNDGFIVKYDKDMNVSWVRTIGGTGAESIEGIAVSSNGDVYAVGFAASASTIDGTTETFTPTNTQDGFVLVYDANGTFKSIKKITGTSGSSLCYSIVIDKNDFVYVTGNVVGDTDFGNGKTITSSNGSLSSMFLAQFDNTMTCQWAIAGDCSSLAAAEGWKVNLDKNENILMTGRFGKVINIIGTDNNKITDTQSASSTTDGFVAKLTKQGVCKWIKTVITGGTTRTDMRGVAADSNGNVFVVGSTSAAAIVEGASAAYAFGGNFDNFLAKFSSEGSYLDGFSLGGPNRDEGKSIFVDSNDDVYISGCINGTATTGTVQNFNPKGTAVNKTFYGQDGFFAKYNAGDLTLLQIEKTTTPSKAAQHEIAYNVTLSKDLCRIYVLGYFNNSSTLFDGETGSVTLPVVGSYDVYWTTYSSCLMIKTQTLATGIKGQPYYATIDVGNTIGTVRYEISNGFLPDGLTMSDQGAISGVPTKTGTYSFTVTISDQSSSRSKTFTIDISAGSDCDVRILSDGCTNGKIGLPYSFKFNIQGSGSIVCSVTSGALPAGLTLSTSGLLSGTPAESNVEGIYSFTVRAQKDGTCYDELQINMIIEKSTGINDINSKYLNSFVLYPVPAIQNLTLSTEFSQSFDAEISIVSATSCPVWKKQYKNVTSIQEAIPVNNIPKGFYMVVLSTKEGMIVKPVIIK